MNHTPYPDGDHHPAVIRLRSEFEAARSGVRGIDDLDVEHRARIVAELRTGLPDVASRVAHEIGAEATVAEIHRFVALDIPEPRTAQLWIEILQTATEAAAAAR